MRLTGRAMLIPLVVVDDLDIGRSNGGPDKADAPLVIDADAVLPFAISFKCFQTIAGWLLQVVERSCPMQIKQLATGRAFNRTESRDQNIVEQLFGVSAFERLNHDV